MKTKTLKALIVDQDSGMGKSLATELKNLFTQIHIDSDLARVIKECQEVKPQVIFFNLMLAQRTTNLEILEQLKLDEKTIFFGYNEQHEAELVAHAIELGFQDIFVRPFDADIVASKINIFFLFEKTQDKNLAYSPLRPPLKANLKMPIRLTAVDENGLSFISGNYINKGTTFKLNAPFVKEIFGQETIDLMVTKTWLGENWKEFFFFAEPRIPNEQISVALRRFILGKT